MMSPVAHHRPFVEHRSMHEPDDHQVVYIDRAPEPRGHGLVATALAGLVAGLIRFVAWVVVIAVVLVVVTVGGLWLLGKGVSMLPDTSVTTTTGP